MIETSSAQPRPSGRLWPAATGLAAILAALVTTSGATFISADSIVTRGFKVALDGAEKSGAKTATTDKAGGNLVAGSEDFWLSRAGKGAATNLEIEPAAWSSPAGSLNLAVGDRITIKSQGAERVLEIVDIADVSHGTTRVAAGPDRRDVLVTCRDTNAGGETVRFMTSRLSVPGEMKPVHAL